MSIPTRIKLAGLVRLRPGCDLTTFPKVGRTTPNDMVVVVRVELQGSHSILVACESHWDSKSMCKAHLAMDATSPTI